MPWTFFNSSGEQMIEDGAAIAATQAEMEAASATGDAAFVTPGRTQYHPGVAKVWARILTDGTGTDANYNVASITDTGTGDRTVNYTTAFSAADVHASLLTVGLAGADGVNIFWTAQNAGNIRVLIRDSIASYALEDRVCTLAVFGDQ